jgi:hypothetical protein
MIKLLCFTQCHNRHLLPCPIHYLLKGWNFFLHYTDSRGHLVLWYSSCTSTPLWLCACLTPHSSICSCSTYHNPFDSTIASTTPQSIPLIKWRHHNCTLLFVLLFFFFFFLFLVRVLILVSLVILNCLLAPYPHRGCSLHLRLLFLAPSIIHRVFIFVLAISVEFLIKSNLWVIIAPICLFFPRV